MMNTEMAETIQPLNKNFVYLKNAFDASLEEKQYEDAEYILRCMIILYQKKLQKREQRINP